MDLCPCFFSNFGMILPLGMSYCQALAYIVINEYIGVMARQKQRVYKENNSKSHFIKHHYSCHNK